MRRLLFLTIVFSLVVFVTQGQERPMYEYGYYVKTGDMAPDFEIKTSDGDKYMLSDLRGSVVMLQFTASWCSVCRKEMPFIESEIWKPWKSMGLKVIGIDRDEPLVTVQKFKKDMGISYPLALDPGADIFGLFANKQDGITRNVIIDRKGKIIFLTRLFEQEEFNQMKSIIFKELQKEDR